MVHNYFCRISARSLSFLRANKTVKKLKIVESHFYTFHFQRFVSFKDQCITAVLCSPRELMFPVL